MRGRPRALVQVPTRELAIQVAAVIAPLAATYQMSTLTVFGGVTYGVQRKAFADQGLLPMVKRSLIKTPALLEHHVLVAEEGDHLMEIPNSVSGKATALVATDIVSPGIHVDDVSQLARADPPVEQSRKAARSVGKGRLAFKNTGVLQPIRGG